MGSARRTIRDGSLVAGPPGDVVEMTFTRVVTEPGRTYTMTARVLVRQGWGLIKTYGGTTG